MVDKLEELRVVIWGVGLYFEGFFLLKEKLYNTLITSKMKKTNFKLKNRNKIVVKIFMHKAFKNMYLRIFS